MGHVQSARNVRLFIPHRYCPSTHLVENTGLTRTRWLATEHPGGMGGKKSGCASWAADPCLCMVVGDLASE